MISLTKKTSDCQPNLPARMSSTTEKIDITLNISEPALKVKIETNVSLFLFVQVSLIIVSLIRIRVIQFFVSFLANKKIRV